jgi:predicted dehydrogenase
MGQARLDGMRQLKAAGRPIEVLGVHDPLHPSLPALAAEFGTRAWENYDGLLAARPDWVFVCTPHDVAVDAVCAALQRGYRTMVEKPLGRSVEEARRMLAAGRSEDQLWVGLNFRFFDGIAAALHDLAQGRFGRLVSLTITMGHGGAPNLAGSWKIDPVRAGGGVLIDPGIHILDLARLMAGGPLTPRSVLPWRGFWNTGIEEECHVLLEGAGFLVNLQISIVRWRSTFALEIHGVEGYGIVTGSGRSYGPQTYVRGVRWGWLKGPRQRETEETVATSDGRNVFANEIDALLFPKPDARVKPCSGPEALKTMELLEETRRLMGGPGPT